MGGLFDLMDRAIAEQLNTDVETFIWVIDGIASEKEAKIIINAMLGNDEEEKTKARELFNKLKENYK